MKYALQRWRLAALLALAATAAACNPESSEPISDVGSDAMFVGASDLGSSDDTSVADVRDTRPFVDDGVLRPAALDVVDLPAAVPLAPPVGCETHEPFEIPLVFRTSRLVVDAEGAEQDEIWTWGRDHYVTAYVRSGAAQVDELAFLSEVLGPRMFPIELDDSEWAVVNRNEVWVQRADAPSGVFSTYFNSPDQHPTWVLDVIDDDRMILYESETLDVWSCPLRCPEPDFVRTVNESCPMAQNCERLTTLPEPEHPRAINPFVDGSEVYWLGETGVWKTTMAADGASVLVLDEEARSFATDGSWVAWIDDSGDGFLAQRGGTERYRLASNLPEPGLDEPGSGVWTEAKVDLLRIEDGRLWWWDGAEIRAVDLDQQVQLDAEWTEQQAEQPVGFEFGSCSSYLLFEDRIVVRPLVGSP